VNYEMITSLVSSQILLLCSDDGIYVASGTISGSVSVYISFSLQVLVASYLVCHI